MNLYHTIIESCFCHWNYWNEIIQVHLTEMHGQLFVREICLSVQLQWLGVTHKASSEPINIIIYTELKTARRQSSYKSKLSKSKEYRLACNLINCMKLCAVQS